MPKAAEVCDAPVGDWLAKAEAYLRKGGVDEALANAEFIMADVLETGRGELRAAGERIVGGNKARNFWNKVKERGRRIPLAYVLGYQPFMGLDIKVTPSVLVPRPETEQMVECVVETARKMPGGAAHVVDIGTGSGCVAVSLAKQLPAAIIYATEISDSALRIAEENARSHGVSARIRFLREDLFKAGEAAGASFGWADIVVSNPPYIPSAEIVSLQEEVRGEPVLALDGGRDGLDAVRAIAADSPRMLKRGGWLALEFGDGQGEKAREILEGGRFTDIELRKDLFGCERIALAQLAAG